MSGKTFNTALFIAYLLALDLPIRVIILRKFTNDDSGPTLLPSAQPLCCRLRSSLSGRGLCPGPRTRPGAKGDGGRPPAGPSRRASPSAQGRPLAEDALGPGAKGALGPTAPYGPKDRGPLVLRAGGPAGGTRVPS